MIRIQDTDDRDPHPRPQNAWMQDGAAALEDTLVSVSMQYSNCTPGVYQRR